jgi:UTP--glucose-1-phosphate uridylyltransferase
MAGLTRGAPKELLPVAGTPALEWVVRECVESGIDEVLVVTAPGKEAIERHFAPRAGAPGMPRRLEFVVQPEPRGLADAIRLGRDFAAGGPLAVALPDNLFLGEVPGLAEVIEAFARHAMSAVAIVEIDAEEAARRGPTAIYQGALDGDDFHIAHIPSKGAHGATFDLRGAHSAFTGVGRYVFTDELFPTIDEVERALPPGAELDDVPVMQSLLARGRLIGRRMRGRFLDIGLPSGYEEANALLEAQR